MKRKKLVPRHTALKQHASNNEKYRGHEIKIFIEEAKQPERKKNILKRHCRTLGGDGWGVNIRRLHHISDI